MTQFVVKRTLLRIPSIIHKLLALLARAGQMTLAVARLALARIKPLALCPISHYTRWGLYPQAVIIVVGLCFYELGLFIPTFAIGFLAVVAAIMTVRADRFTHGERAVYVLIAFALFLVEMRAVYKDRDEHDRQQAEARAQEERNFREIASGLTEAIAQSKQEFHATMERSNAVLVGVRDSIFTQTGGDSFAFISFVAQQAQPFEMHWGDLLAPRGTPYFVVCVTSRGRYPLRGIRATMMDDERRLAAMKDYNEHPSGDWIRVIDSADTEYTIPYLRPQSPEAPGGEVDIVGLYPISEADSKRLSISFAAPNGYWNEVLHLGLVNGAWHECLSVMGPTTEQAKRPFIYCDSEWPEGKALADKDWVFTPPKKKR